MLFRSGSATRIDVGLHEPGEGGHSAKSAYVIKECDPAMQDAAERGRLAALEWWARRGGTAPAPAYRVSFDLPGVRSGENVGGASGGLAFAVAVARAVRAALEGVDAGAGAGRGAGAGGGAVAAAGELGSGLSGGPVRGVQGIEAKIEGALACLPAGSLLLYPKANDPEVSAGLRERLREGGVEAMAVESVDGALDRIFPPRDAAAAPPARPRGEAGSPGRHGFPSPRPGAAAPRRLAVAGLIVVAGAAAAALLIAGSGQGDGRWPFGPSPKGDGIASAEPDRPASPDAGFEGETGAGAPHGAPPQVRPERAGRRRAPADGSPSRNAGGTAALPGRAAPVAPAGAPPSASGGAPSPEGRRPFRPHDPPREPAGALGEPSDQGFD